MAISKQAILTALNAEGSNTAGFAKIVAALKDLGVVSYRYQVAAGTYVYTDGAESIEMPLNGTPQPVAEQSQPDAVAGLVKQAQQGAFTFPEFCQQAGQLGVSYWDVSMSAMTTTYYDEANTELLVEPI